MMNFRLRASPERLREVLASYDVALDRSLNSIAENARQQGHLNLDQLLVIVRWKSPRAITYAKRNRSEFVEEVTRTSLSTADEQLRIEVLTLMRGVGWSTASVILHFCHPNRYPILDVRALWTVGFDKRPSDDFQFWEAYTEFCRHLATDLGWSMRELDRALWSFSVQAGEAAAP